MAETQDVQSRLSVLESTIDNASKIINFNKQDYIVLVKKQKDKNYCTLYLSDCCENFWLEKIDIQFCQTLKQQIQIKSPLPHFLSLLANGLKNTTIISSLTPRPVLRISLSVGEGLLLNCTLPLELHYSLRHSPQQYKKLSKCFFKHLYEAKQAQVNFHKNACENMKKNMEEVQRVNKQVNDPNYIKNVLNANMKKNVPPPPKNRDLLNPNKKKRKHNGAKFQDDDN